MGGWIHSHQSISVLIQLQETGTENGNGRSFGRNVWSWFACAFPGAHRYLTFFFHRLRRTQHYSMLPAFQVAFLVLSFVLFSSRSFLRRVRSILAARGGLLHRKLPPLPISIWPLGKNTILVRLVLRTCHLYLPTRNPGILYLGPFSGPVEGILMIVIIYIITGIFGKRILWQIFQSHSHRRPYILGQEILDFHPSR